MSGLHIVPRRCPLTLTVPSVLTARNAIRLQPLAKQFDQRLGRFCLPFARDVLDERTDCTLDQETQNCARVHAGDTGHVYRLSKYPRWVRPTRSDALNPADKCFDGWKRTVWHFVGMADWVATRIRRLWHDVLDPFSRVV
jgi:hypothetical protein